MNTHQTRWLLLLGLGLFSLSGATCSEFLVPWTAPPLPRVLPPSPTVEQVIEVVNRNNSQIQSFSTNQASISGPNFPTLRASVAFQRPQRFRLRAETGLTGTELDLGSNDELFWFWCRREQPPAIYYCRHDQFAGSQAQQTIRFEPAWLIEALGVAQFDPALPHQLAKPLPNDRLRIDTIRNTPEGPVAKVTIVDGSQGWILEQHFYDARGRPVAHSIASQHRVDPLTGLVMPMVVQIDCPSAQLSMRIDLGNVQINRLSGDSAALWSMPSYPGAGAVDLAAPGQPLPSGHPPVSVSTNPHVQPANWRRPTGP
jgi:hypothetical protein